ncbi:Hypothetical predicted protein, partial [Pelobates cultripes]
DLSWTYPFASHGPGPILDLPFLLRWTWTYSGPTISPLMDLDLFWIYPFSSHGPGPILD